MTDTVLSERITPVAGLDDHPLLEDYRELREADLAARRHAFIAESRVVLSVLIERGRFPLRSLLLSASRVSKIQPLLAGVAPNVPIFVAEQDVLDRVVGFHIHRGILAAGTRLPVPTPAELLAELSAGPQTVVVLEGLTNHDNVGGVFRNAAAFGAAAVLYDQTTCDPLYRKAIRVSVGGSLVVPFAEAVDSSQCLEALRLAGFTTIALSPRADAEEMAQLCRGGLPKRVALLVGTEGRGLAANTMAGADHLARIDIEPGFDSLNVATASGIALCMLRSMSDRG